VLDVADMLLYGVSLMDSKATAEMSIPDDPARERQQIGQVVAAAGWRNQHPRIRQVVLFQHFLNPPDKLHSAKVGTGSVPLRRIGKAASSASGLFERCRDDTTPFLFGSFCFVLFLFAALLHTLE